MPRRFLATLLWLGIALAGCSDDAPTGWLDAERLEFSNDGHARGMRLALNRQGQGMLVWEQLGGTDAAEIRARPVAVDGAHGAISVLSSRAASPNFPDVAVNAQGRAIAVWIQETSRKTTQVWARTYQPDTGWGSAHLVSGQVEGPLARPRAAVNEAGEMAVVWMQSSQGVFHAFARRHAPARGWGPVMRLDSAKGGVALPQVSLNAQGRLLTTWYQSNPHRDFDVWANHIEPDNPPGAAVQIELAEGQGALPALAQLGDGSTLAVWQQNAATFGQIGLNRFRPKGGWEAPVSLSDIDLAPAHEPAVAAWGAQHAVAAWMQTRHGRAEVWANRIHDGMPGTPRAMYRGQEPSQRQARIGADDQGHAIGMWTQQAGSARTVWAALWPVNGAPHQAQRLDHSETATVAETALGVDARGHALAVWTQEENGRARLWARRYHAP